MSGIDILMVTHRSPERTRLSLTRLLQVCDETYRVWLWHNGDHEPTLDLVKSFASHPRVFRFRHSEENKKLREPINWLFAEGIGSYLSKVDDDSVVPPGWPGRLLDAHEGYDRFGVLGSWRFQEEDFIPELANRKIRAFPGGHRVLQNLWVEGSCFLMKRLCVEEAGLLREGQSFPDYCRGLAMRGWINGWYYPFIRYDNLDDPRSAHSLLRTNEDLRARSPLMAELNGIDTIEEWTDLLRRSARVAQMASLDLRQWRGYRLLLRRALARTRRLLGDQRHW
jgi:cellulose synthase/poly-beta-1,6-N-acetylglucosamine synthase-like glycosyltransferase